MGFVVEYSPFGRWSGLHVPVLHFIVVHFQSTMHTIGNCLPGGGGGGQLHNASQCTRAGAQNNFMCRLLAQPTHRRVRPTRVESMTKRRFRFLWVHSPVNPDPLKCQLAIDMNPWFNFKTIQGLYSFLWGQYLSIVLQFGIHIICDIIIIIVILKESNLYNVDFQSILAV